MRQQKHCSGIFARMEVVMQRHGGGCSDDGGDGGSGDALALAATRAGVGRRFESGQGRKKHGDHGGGNVITRKAGG